MMEESSRVESRRGTCSTCQINAAHYTCPRCHIDSCSLSCITKHKQDSGCNGERDKTAFITIQDYSENNLLSDYRFLEEVNRSKQAAHRLMHSQVHDMSLDSRRTELRNVAQKKRVQFAQMPTSFSRSKRNRSSARNRVIHWTVEVKFVQSGVKFIEDFIYENEKLETVLNRFLKDPIKKQRIKPYVAEGLDKIKVMMATKPKISEPEKRGFHVLDINKTLAENLIRNYVLEFPELIVILEDKLSDYQMFEKEVYAITNSKEMEKNPKAWPKREPKQRLRKKRKNRQNGMDEASPEKKQKTDEDGAEEAEVADASEDKEKTVGDGKESNGAPESAETKEGKKQDVQGEGAPGEQSDDKDVEQGDGETPPVTESESKAEAGKAAASESSEGSEPDDE